MTQKQKDYIEFIEEFSGVRFTGNPESNADLSAFIEKHKEVARVNSLTPWQRKYD